MASIPIQAAQTKLVNHVLFTWGVGGVRCLLTETDGLLGVTRDIDFVEPGQAGLRVGLLNEVGDVGVVGATTAHVDFVNLPVLGREARIVLANCLGGDAGKSRDDIVFVSSRGLNPVDQFDCFFVAEDLPSSCLGDVMFVPPVVVDVFVDDFLVALIVRE